MTSIKRISIGLAAAGLALVPLLALAQIPTPANEVPPPTGPGPSSVGGIFGFLNRILVWVSRLFWIVAVAMILVAAFQFLTAGGSDEKVGTAKKTLIYAIVAIAVALLAGVIPTLVTNFLNGA